VPRRIRQIEVAAMKKMKKVLVEYAWRSVVGNRVTPNKKSPAL
jgi:hypothetical protein